ncbi:MAG: hypothetical protein KGI60_03895 [Patescibacteria group bacterium]|nr:hypothetical protein [Patescibacteria group bacterium]
MEELKQNYRHFWEDRDLLYSSVVGVLFLIASLIINYAAGMFATLNASNSVTDIILDNVPRMNVEYVFVQGILLFLAFVAYLLIKDPRRIPFALKSIAFFVIVRSIFVSLTHFAPFPDNNFDVYGSFIKNFTFGGDLFFSGHTGLPFLMALLFWQNKRLRFFFICASIFFGTAVLLGHLHYSIDVFAAFFITDSVYRLGSGLFSKDKALFAQTMQ